MIYKIENKKIQVMLKNEVIELPIKLKNKINENFENMKKTGANIWNGEVLCVSECNIEDDKVEIICKNQIMLIIYMEKEWGVQKDMNAKI